VDFAIPSKGMSLLDIYEQYRKKGEKAAGDYGLHIGIVEFNEKVAKEMEILTKEKGINSFKVFMAYKNVNTFLKHLRKPENWVQL
jgi:dihydropyrimidinase